MQRSVIAALLVSFAAGCASSAGAITTYSDRAAFEDAAPLQPVEEFTGDAHFPISTGILNSETNLSNIGCSGACSSSA